MPSEALAQAYSEHGPAMTVVGYFSRAVRYAKRGIKMRDELNDTLGTRSIARVPWYHAICRFALS